MQLHTWNAQYAKVYQICNICKNIQLYAIYAKNIHICKISMYVSIQGEAKSAALDRTHHLLGMQEGTNLNGPGRSCRRVCAGRHRRGSGQTGPLQSARGQRSPRIGPSSLDRPKASKWPLGGPGRPSRPSHPLPALWIGPGRRGGTHLAQAKGPLSLCQAPLASALPAPPTGTGWPVHASEARPNRAGRSRRGGGRRAAGGRRRRRAAAHRVSAV